MEPVSEQHPDVRGSKVDTGNGGLLFENDGGGDFVPPSLVDFLSKSKATLENAQASIRQQLQSDNSRKPQDLLDSFEGEHPTSPVEDDQDRLLKKQIMDKYKAQETLFSPTESDFGATPPLNPAAVDITLSQAKRMALHSDEKVTVSVQDYTLHTNESLKEAFELEATVEAKEEKGEPIDTDGNVNRSLEGAMDHTADENRVTDDKQEDAAVEPVLEEEKPITQDEPRQAPEEANKRDEEQTKAPVGETKSSPGQSPPSLLRPASVEQEEEYVAVETVLDEDDIAMQKATETSQAQLEKAEQSLAAARESKLLEEKQVKAAMSESKNSLARESSKRSALSPSLSGVSDDAFLPNRNPTSTQRRVEATKPQSNVTTRRTKRATRARPVPTKTKTSIRKSGTGPCASSRPTSRLMQGTSSSIARTGSTEPKTPRTQTSTVGSTASKATSRLMRETASSRARTSPPGKTQVPQRPQTRRDPKVIEDGLTRARERVRRHKLQAKDLNAKPSSSQDNERKVQEGRARAKERIRHHKLEMQQKSGKENISKSKRDQHTTAQAGRKGRVSPTHLTTPRASPTGWSENPISRAAGMPTHSSSPPRKSSVRGSKPSVTVPKPPRLSTLAKYGDKPPPTVVAKKDEAPSPKHHASSRPHLTVPKPFHFHGKTPSSQPPIRKERTTEPSLAEQMELLTRKGFGNLSAGTTPRKRDGKVTIPKTPQFAETHQRPLPKSTMEKEEEEMEYFRKHPFKAQPIMMDVREVPRTVPKAPKRRLTMPKPFHLRSDERATHAKPLPRASEEEDMQECKKRFHARPMPDFKKKASRTSLPSSVPRSTVTTPNPFQLSTAARSEPRRKPSTDTEKEEMVKPFHARPLPRSTFVATMTPKPSARGVASGAATPGTARSTVGPPRLATSARTDRRQAATEASRRNAQAMTRDRQRSAVRRQREKHAEAMIKSLEHSPLLAKSPKQVTPFRLHSEERHAASVHSREVQLQQERLEAQRRREFHARPMKESPPPPPIERTRPLTEPQPFHLQSVARHEIAKSHELQAIASQEEEMEKASHFVARPVPQTTYHAAKPAGPATVKTKLVSPRAPNLQSTQRAQQRKEFDAAVELEREQEAARKLAMEQQLKAEQEEEIREWRRLPSSEGGFMPTIEPINAVFYKKEQD